MNYDHCLVCNSRDLESNMINEIIIQNCKFCNFQFIPNNKKYLSNEYFSNYFTQRNSSKNQKLNDLRKKQYRIDAKFLSQYTNDSSKLLDVGCSSGEFINEINNHCDVSLLSGIDIDVSAIDEAIKKYSDIANFENEDLLSISGDKRFDLIIFRGTFQYLDQNLHKAISKVKTILNQNGKIIIYSLPSYDSFIYYLLKDKWSLFHPEMSLMFNEKSFRHLCHIHSLDIEYFNYPYLGDIYSNIKKDYEQVEKIIDGSSDSSTPFWGAVMQIIISPKE